MVVEDDQVIGELAATALKTAGFKALLVRDGLEALNEILKTRPDVVVLDLNLPRLAGFDICGILRRSVSIGRVPIIVMSGMNGHCDRLRAFKLGVDDYVGKPFDADELVARVTAVFQRSQQLRFPDPIVCHQWE
jgi:chemosensory pili system protein ChpA (sensor histidine kinase/response regulator)